MALTTIKELFRVSEGGKAFRVYDVTHDESTLSVDAKDLDLDYIECIWGVNTCMSMETTNSSEIIDQLRISIGADNKSLVWDDTTHGTQTICVVGW